MRRHVLTNNPQVFKFHDTAERKHSATESLLKFLESLSDRKKTLSLELFFSYSMQLHCSILRSPDNDVPVCM